MYKIHVLDVHVLPGSKLDDRAFESFNMEEEVSCLLLSLQSHFDEKKIKKTKIFMDFIVTAIILLLCC